MRAAVHTRYGPPEVVQVRQVPAPRPGAGEVLIRVHATTVSRSDCGLRRPHPWFVRLAAGLLRPRLQVLGLDFAGVVQAVGTGVTQYKPGDRVFGLSPDTYGAHAEYLCLPATAPMAALPAGLPFTQAVVCEGAWYASTYLQAMRLRPGQRILVYGASGAIGTAAVQLAKSAGAEVTAVVETRHLELVRSLGPDHAVDCTAQDFTQIGRTFDAVFDAVGKTSYFRCRRMLEPDGVFAATDLGPWCQNPLLAIGSAITRSGRVLFPLPQQAQARALVELLKTRIEAGAFRAVIDRVCPLEAIVEAYRYVETERKAGIVAIDTSAGEPDKAGPRGGLGA